MATDTKASSIMGCSMAKVNLLGVMVLCMRVYSRIIGLPVRECISGRMAVCIRGKSKMGSGMDTGCIRFKMPLIKDSGNKARNKVKVKLYLKVEAYFRGISKMISNQAWVKCITTHLVIIFKETGSMI